MYNGNKNHTIIREMEVRREKQGGDYKTLMNENTV